MGQIWLLEQKLLRERLTLFLLVMIMLILQVITEQITFYMVMRQVEDTYSQDNQVNHLFHKVGIPN